MREVPEAQEKEMREMREVTEAKAKEMREVAEAKEKEMREMREVAEAKEKEMREMREVAEAKEKEMREVTEAQEKKMREMREAWAFSIQSKDVEVREGASQIQTLKKKLEELEIEAELSEEENQKEKTSMQMVVTEREHQMGDLLNLQSTLEGQLMSIGQQHEKELAEGAHEKSRLLKECHDALHEAHRLGNTLEVSRTAHDELQMLLEQAMERAVIAEERAASAEALSEKVSVDLRLQTAQRNSLPLEEEVGMMDCEWSKKAARRDSELQRVLGEQHLFTTPSTPTRVVSTGFGSGVARNLVIEEKNANATDGLTASPRTPSKRVSKSVPRTIDKNNFRALRPDLSPLVIKAAVPSIASLHGDPASPRSPTTA